MIKRTSYKSLCTAFYDADKPVACLPEIDFYAQQLQTVQSPILEAMCGSGRLMIPLLERGFEIEGIDFSSEMLNSLSVRLQQKNSSATFYEGDILHHHYSKKYGAIIIAVGSFQLITDLNQALKILQKFYQILLPNGLIIIDTFIPKELSQQSEPEVSVRAISLDAQTKIEIHSNSIVDIQKQIYTTQNHYQKYHENKLSDEEHESLSVRWYQELEFRLLLEKAGFKSVQCIYNHFQHNPDAYTFIAIK